MLMGAGAATSMMMLEKGQKAKFSNEQICLLVIDMAYAKKHLSKDEYKQMKKIYQEVMKEKQKENIDYSEFVDKAVAIVKRFEVVAPYEKFCGDEPDAYGPIMAALRK